MSVTTSSISSEWWKTPTVTETTSTTGTNNLDFNAFLQLLTTELQYQDPLDPVSNTEYVAQMAQISSLQQLHTISQSINMSAAFNLIGKEVTYQTTASSTEDTVTQSGVVESVVTKNNTAYLIIDGSWVAYSSVVEVSNPASAEA